ncbi:hypothetical protein ACJ5H2_20225 [Nocardioides sp. R1-1]|uniref:hypothetical protein n=1 Tax=Nocardioides sp. R1-1 TaxID=3383502 RepID=UPI0038D076E5
MRSTHLTLGSLALVAVVGVGSGLLPSAAATPGIATSPGDPRGCGQPEVPAQWGTVEHPAVTRTVPAVTRSEWRWERTVDTVERAYAREISAAVVVVRWTRTVDLLEIEHTRTVVDRPAEPGSPEEGHHETRVVAPAVVQTEWEFVQQQTGNTRWEDEGWNAGDNGKGWSPTGRTREVEVTPAVTEQVWVVDRAAVPARAEESHVETLWLPAGTTPPAGAAPTGATRVASSSTQELDLPVGESPAGTGWVPVASSQIGAAEEERVWLPDGVLPADGFLPTGETRPGAPRQEATTVTTPLPPAGEGWSPVPGSEVVVALAAAYEEVVEPAWVEDFVVVPAQPATAPCAQPGDGSEVLPVDEGVDPPSVVPALPEVPVAPAVLGETEVQPVTGAVVPAGEVAPATVVAPSGALPASGA